MVCSTRPRAPPRITVAHQSTRHLLLAAMSSSQAAAGGSVLGKIRVGKDQGFPVVVAEGETERQAILLDLDDGVEPRSFLEQKKAAGSVKIKWLVAMRDDVVPASTVRPLEVQANRTARKRPARAEKAAASTNRSPVDSSEERRPVCFDRGSTGVTVHYLTQSELRATFNGGDPNDSGKVSLWEETHKVQAETNKKQAAKIQQLEKQLEEAKKSHKRKLSALEIKMRTERWTAAATHIERLEEQVKAAQEAERNLERQLHEATEQYNRLRAGSHADIVLLNEKVEELTQQLQTANTSYNQLLSASESVAKERNSAKSRIGALELENQRLLASESECKKKLEAAEGTKAQALADNSSLKSGLVQAKSLASKCKARVEECQKAIETLRGDNTSAEAVSVAPSL